MFYHQNIGWLLSSILLLAGAAYAAGERKSAACLSSLTQSKCALKKQFLEINWSTGACPRCRIGLGLGKTKCDEKKRKCAPGLKCVNMRCVLDKSNCLFAHHLSHLRNVPACKVDDGTFAEKQCKGDMLYGRCFCSDRFGSRTFGFSWRKEADRMTCACSRLHSELERNGREDVTYHCSANGNFEPLQCDSGICWCVDERTGRPDAALRAVPQSLWKQLPCYNRAEMGERYGRQCESVRMAQITMQTALRKRGTLNMSFGRVNCDYAGGFGAYKIENGISACVSPDGKRIDSFQVPAGAVATQNCNCAQDRVTFRSIGSELSLSCAGNGNYDTVQLINGNAICVDADGFAVSGLMNATAPNLLDACKQLVYQSVIDADVD